MGADRHPDPVILVNSGSRDIMVRTRASCVVISLIVEVSPDIQGDLASLPEATQRGTLRTLRDHLLAQPRSNAIIEPSDAVSIAQVSRVVVEQTFRIGAQDPASFNRLADGIQEVTNAAVGACARVGALIDAASRRTGSRDRPPPGMYA